MVRAQPTLRIPRPDLLPLRLREVLWEDRPSPARPQYVQCRLELRDTAVGSAEVTSAR